jgi:hypothetical protein
MAAKALNLERLYAVPRFVRAMVSVPYPFRESWVKRGKFEYLARICRRSLDMQKTTAGVALNSLRNLAYHFPQDVVEDCLASFEKWQTLAMDYEPFEKKLSAADVSLVCSGIYAQKTRMPLHQNGYTVLFPYLHPQAIQFSMNSPLEAKAGKAQLKRLLAEAVPAHLVYRDKVGFLSPNAVRMSEPFWADLMSECMQDSEIRRYICGNTWDQIRDRLTQHVAIPDPIYHFIWTVVFFYLWRSSLAN